jgi:hypothetical protein
LFRSSSNTDPWVAAALKSFDRDLYDRIWGWTRRGLGLPGIYWVLAKFGGVPSTFTELDDRTKDAILLAVDQAKEAFRLEEPVEPLDWPEAIEALKPDTSAGISFIGKKGENKEAILEAARGLAHKCKWQKTDKFDPSQIQFPPCKASTRGHLSSREEVKTRLVWVYPAEILAIEAKYAEALYRKYRLRHFPMMTGAYPIYEFDKVGRPGVYTDTYVGMDFSAFDTTIPSYICHYAFEVIRENINWTVWGGKPLTPGQIKRWTHVWSAIVWYFINTPLLMPDGVLWRKHRGVPSGSFFTQLGDSVINYIVISASCNWMQVPCWGLRVLGDDSAFATSAAFRIEDSVPFFDKIGMTIKPEKSDVVKTRGELKLLGYRLNTCFRARDDPEEWFRMVLYPEHSPEDLSISWSRVIGLFIAGGSHDELYSKFVDYYHSGYPVQSELNLSRSTVRFLRYVAGIEVPAGFSIGPELWTKTYTFIA